MEKTAVQTLLGCMEEYDQAMGKVAAQLRPGDGLLGFGRDPKRDPCHMAFYEAVGEAVGQMAREGLPPREAEEAVRFLLELFLSEDYNALTRPMRRRSRAMPGPWCPSWTGAARELADWYGRQYPRHRRLPVQSQLFKDLERRGRGK